MECSKGISTHCFCKKCAHQQSDDEFIKLVDIKTETIQRFKCLTKNCEFTTNERENLILHLLKHE